MLSRLSQVLRTLIDLRPQGHAQHSSQDTSLIAFFYVFRLIWLCIDPKQERAQRIKSELSYLKAAHKHLSCRRCCGLAPARFLHFSIGELRKHLQEVIQQQKGTMDTDDQADQEDLEELEEDIRAEIRQCLYCLYDLQLTVIQDPFLFNLLLPSKLT